MKPAVVFPLGDISEVMFGHLQNAAPVLPELFDCAYVSVAAGGGAAHAVAVDWLDQQTFFRIVLIEVGQPVGEQFARLFRAAAQAAPAEQVLHLCYIDRLAFALGSGHRAAFMEDIRTLAPADTPLIYQRSQAAWDTHPGNYVEIEGMVSRTGRLLFNTALDYAWCHLAAQAGDLRGGLAAVSRTDLAMVAEIVLAFGVNCRTKSVDWLAWEDPYILGQDAVELRNMREASVSETQKRLAYAIPMLQLLQTAARNGKR